MLCLFIVVFVIDELYLFYKEPIVYKELDFQNTDKYYNESWQYKHKKKKTTHGIKYKTKT